MSKEQIYMVESGNELAAFAASQINYHVMGYFPITPSTQIAEYLDELKSDGKNTVNMIPADGEHGAAGICYGASTAGGRVLNATSANGLLYAMEQLPVQSHTRFPMVLNIVTRSVSGPLDIKCDHSDIMMTLNTGWLIIFAKSPQEVYDFNIMAPKIAEDENVRLPIIVAYDGFFTSHQKKKVQVFKNDKDVKDFVGPFKAKYTSIDVENPLSIGCYMNEPDYINNHYQLAKVMEKAKEVICRVFDEFEKISGRKYYIVQSYMAEDAEVIIYALGSSVDTVITAIDDLRKEGKKVGVVWPNVIRPLPKEEIYSKVKNAKVILALDRQDSYNEIGGNLSTELKALLQEKGATNKVISRVYGLGGRELYIDEAKELFEIGFKALKEEVKTYDYYGVEEGNEDTKLPAGLKPLTFDMQDNGIEVQMVNGKLDVKNINLRKLTKQAKRFSPGHGACIGCGIFSGLNTFMRGLKGYVVVLFHTGCGMVVSTGYPFNSHRITYIHNLFQNGAATLSGVVEMYKEKQRRGEIAKDKEITFVIVTGDGGADIGMGPIIGTANRNHNLIILEYDNEGYMNTGNQLSYSTPLGHETSTSHVGDYQKGKRFHHKDTPMIMAGTHIPYIFTSSEAFPIDLIKKAAKAQWYANNMGTVYGKILSACPLNWRSEPSLGTKIVKAATDCNFFPLYEIEQGITTLTYDPEKAKSKINLEDWLGMMGKTKHLLAPENKEVLEAARKEIERRFKRLKIMSEHPEL